MTSVLITGMSGTGKSTVLAELRRRGHEVVESDEPGWCTPVDGNWLSPDTEWVLDENRLHRLLDKKGDSNLFIDATRENQGKFYDRLDHVVVFTAPLKVMLQRITDRTNNPFGKSDEERERIARDKVEFEPLLLQGANLVIDTSLEAPAKIADRLEALL